MPARAPSHAQQSVPFLDLGPSHKPLRDAILADLGAVIDTNAFVNGSPVAEFETAFAAYSGSTHCVGVASGLDALRLALLAVELEPGDEVIVPASTFVATIEAVTQAGLAPVLVDVLDTDYCLDPDAAEAATGTRSRAIMPVHLYGQMADMRAIGALAARHELTLVEDAAQAQGATRDGVRAGTVGHAAGFSFYPGKNLGAMGDAGALTTDSEAIASRVRALREHGQQEKYIHRWEGYTSRLDTMQAVVLNHKLPELDRWNAERADVARRYTETLDEVGDLRLPAVPAGSHPVWHLYVIRTERPQELADHLRGQGIATGRHYPVPVHLSPAYEGLGHGRGAFPVSEALSRECLSLPIYPGVSESQVDAVVQGIRAFFDDR